MRNQRKSLRPAVVAIVLAVVAGSWGGAPVAAGVGGQGVSPEAREGAMRSGPSFLSTALAEGISAWLEALGLPGFRSVTAPGGVGMDPNGAPETAEPPVEDEGGVGMDPNG